jgi:hypothetical protein
MCAEGTGPKHSDETDQLMQGREWELIIIVIIIIII